MSLSPALVRVRDALTVCDERAPLVSVTLPLTTVSEANSHTHWRVRQTRAKSHRQFALMAVGGALRRDWPVGGWRGAELVVLLTRVAPRELDSDNLQGALKHVRDGVADALGVDDRDERVTWAPCDQRKGKAGVVIEIFSMARGDK